MTQLLYVIGFPFSQQSMILVWTSIDLTFLVSALTQGITVTTVIATRVLAWCSNRRYVSLMHAGNIQ